MVQGAVLLLVTGVFGGGAIWRAPVISELLCLGMSGLFLSQYIKDQQQWLPKGGEKT